MVDRVRSTNASPEASRKAALHKTIDIPPHDHCTKCGKVIPPSIFQGSLGGLLQSERRICSECFPNIRKQANIGTGALLKTPMLGPYAGEVIHTDVCDFVIGPDGKKRVIRWNAPPP